MKSEQVAGAKIDGVDFRKLKMNHDDRGTFTEVFQKSWDTVITPCQWSAVTSKANTLRGCHLHMRHDEYFCLLSGEVTLGLRDERPDSATYGHWQMYRLYGEDLAALTFPVGIIHGWYFHKLSTHIQAVSESYVDYGTDDNFGVHWSDKELEIPWDFTNPLIAERSANFGSLSELREQIKAIPATEL
ncbi:MAG: dTDP-4-dehydrorhamnose 3,5-epimerase family protein [Bacteroidota bacterium]